MGSNVNTPKNKQIITREIIEEHFNLGSDLISKLGGHYSISIGDLHVRLYSWGFNILNTEQRYDFDFVYDKEEVRFYEYCELPLNSGETRLLSIDIMRKFQKLGFPEKEHFKPFNPSMPPKIIITPVTKGDNTFFIPMGTEISDERWVLNLDDLIRHNY